MHTTYGLYQRQPTPPNGLIINTSDGVVLIDTGWGTKDDAQLDLYNEPPCRMVAQADARVSVKI